MPHKPLTALSEDAYNNSAAHGFWEDLPWDILDGNPSVNAQDRATYIGNKLMLIVGEVAEAHEELRKNTDPRHTYYREDGKPEGLPVELADILIRVFDLAGHLGLDLDRLVDEKMAHNVKRPAKHGKAF